MYPISQTRNSMCAAFVGRFSIIHFFSSSYIISDTKHAYPFPVPSPLPLGVLRREYNTQSPQTIECGNRHGMDGFLPYFYLIFVMLRIYYSLVFLRHVCLSNPIPSRRSAGAGGGHFDFPHRTAITKTEGTAPVSVGKKWRDQNRAIFSFRRCSHKRRSRPLRDPKCLQGALAWATIRKRENIWCQAVIHIQEEGPHAGERQRPKGKTRGSILTHTGLSISYSFPLLIFFYFIFREIGLIVRLRDNTRKKKKNSRLDQMEGEGHRDTKIVLRLR